MIPQCISLPPSFPVTSHTNFVRAGSTFVAIKGYSEDGTTYIKDALDKGATTIVVAENTQLDDDIKVSIATHKAALLRVNNTRKALADLSARAAQFPARALKIIGITGTKGKTTTSFLLEHCLRTAGCKTALISSAGNKIGDTAFAASLTTPQADYLHQFLSVCVANAIDYVVMEVAAQALTLHRVENIEFDGIIFTNFSHEHLEFYETLDDYWAAKCRIFTMAKPDAPLCINYDDEHGKQISKHISNNKIVLYGFCHKNNTQGTPLYTFQENQLGEVIINTDNEFFAVQCPALFGHYNSYNSVAAVSMAHQLGIKSDIFQKAFLTFPVVPGRLQRISLPNDAFAFIDYAHNPSSFEAVLSTLRQLTDRLIVVFGAGGGKDKNKRPLMGAIACAYADHVILTSDNPRFENPETIIADIQGGIPINQNNKVIVIIDRQVAIAKAYALSKKGTIIALLGKGPDEYQMIGKTKHFFSEQQILQQLSL